MKLFAFIVLSIAGIANAGADYGSSAPPFNGAGTQPGYAPVPNPGHVGGGPNPGYAPTPPVNNYLDPRTPQSGYGSGSYEKPHGRRHGKCQRHPSPSCPATTDYAAVLFEQDHFAGIKHWVDGKDGDCRGLSGADVQSIRIISEAGGDPVFGAATNAFARGVSLTFFPEFNCQGNPLGRTAGNQLDLSRYQVKPLSVRINCNGKGSGKNEIAKVGSPSVITLFEQANFQGIQHTTDGVAGECRGLSGVDVASIQFRLDSNQRRRVGAPKKVIFYEDDACSGRKLAMVFGSHSDTCMGRNSCGLNPRSVMFAY